MSRPIPGWPGYLATEEGSILSKQTGEPLRPRQHWRTGHLRVRLYCADAPRRRVRRDGCEYMERWQDVYVHVAVALAFHGPPPSPDLLVRHLDGNPEHNWPSNLAWGTREENAADRERHAAVDDDGFDWSTGEVAP